jgi:ubiquinone/menaquinone biosynthesis C-methylase UbiE
MTEFSPGRLAPEIGAYHAGARETAACSQPETYSQDSPTETENDSLTLKRQIREFWQNSPCDSWFADGASGTPAFYRSLDEHRYRVHPGLPEAVGFEKTNGLQVLEIGCGCGSEAERFARAGAHYTAVDLTNAAVSLTQKRFQLAGLAGCFVQGDAENLPFADDSFDLVYSHGVLHHTPDTPRTIREVYRVLAPGGRAIIMLYYRNSFNYQINLRMVRRLRAHLLKSRLGFLMARNIGHETIEELQRHAELIRQDPHAIDMQNMLNRNTDGPDNPLSQVFSRESACRMFWQFSDVKTKVMFWNPNWLPGIGRLLPDGVDNALAARWGWHLWIYGAKRNLDFTPQPAPTPSNVKYPALHVLARPLRTTSLASWARPRAGSSSRVNQHTSAASLPAFSSPPIGRHRKSIST